MSATRRRLLPKSLVSLVLDADTRLIDGEADQPVELEGFDWAEIVAAADRENGREFDGPMALVDAANIAGGLRPKLEELIELRARVAELEPALASADLDRKVLHAEVTELRAFKAGHEQIGAELEDEVIELRAFKADVVKAMGGQEWAGDNYLIEAIATDRARSAELADQRLAALDAADKTDAELEDLRAFKADVVKAMGGQEWAGDPLTVLESVIESWRELCERNVDGSAYTFSKIAPTIEAFLGENDGKGTDPSGRECNVRFLLDGGAGCMIDFQAARDVAHEILRKVDEALFPVAAEKKKRAPKKKPAAVGPCIWCDEHGHSPDECALRPADATFDPLPPPKKTPPADDRQIDFTTAHTKTYRDRNARPTRPTKKFPLHSGLTEKCTACGAELGAHAGTKCPIAGAA